MKAVIIGMLGVGGLGTFVLTANGVGQKVERIVDRSPASTYASFEEALKPLSWMPPRDTALGREVGSGTGAMKFAYKADPGKHITLSVLLNGAEMADMDFDFAPDEQSERTKLTVTMAPGKSAPPRMQLALALGNRAVFEKMVDETVRRVELGLPVAPEFARLGQSQDYVAREASMMSGMAARNPDSVVRMQEYERERAQRAASEPAREAGRPMLDPGMSGGY